MRAFVCLVLMLAFQPSSHASNTFDVYENAQGSWHASFKPHANLVCQFSVNIQYKQNELRLVGRKYSCQQIDMMGRSIGGEIHFQKPDLSAKYFSENQPLPIKIGNRECVTDSFIDECRGAFSSSNVYFPETQMEWRGSENPDSKVESVVLEADFSRAPECRKKCDSLSGKREQKFQCLLDCPSILENISLLDSNISDLPGPSISAKFRLSK